MVNFYLVGALRVCVDKNAQRHQINNAPYTLAEVQRHEWVVDKSDTTRIWVSPLSPDLNELKAR